MISPRCNNKLCLLVALGMALGGCLVQELDPDDSFLPTAQDGLVVVSLTRTGVRQFDLLLWIRGEGFAFQRVVKLPDYGSRLDWHGAPERGPTPKNQPIGRLVVMELPPGDYEISNWLGQSPMDGFYGDGYDIRSEPISLKFRVLPGEITYGGRVQLVLPDEVNYLANLVPSTYRIETSDMQASDLTLLREKYPRVSADTVQVRLIESADTGRPLLYYVDNRELPAEKIFLKP